MQIVKPLLTLPGGAGASQKNNAYLKVDNNEEGYPKHLDWSLPDSNRLSTAKEQLWPLREADHHTLGRHELCRRKKTDPPIQQ